MKIIIFGTGMVARRLMSYPLRPEHSILGICDNNSEKWGQDFFGYKVQPPESLGNADIIILAVVRGWMDVHKQLTDSGIASEKILHAVGWSKLDYFPDPLDMIFSITKKSFVPFTKKPVKSLGHCGGETAKAHDRRVAEAFFERYCNGEGLDIGCGNDPVVSGCYGWDLMNGDAQRLEGIGDEEFDWVYSSHCLEHVDDVRDAIRNWFRVVRHGGGIYFFIFHTETCMKKGRTFPQDSILTISICFSLEGPKLQTRWILWKRLGMPLPGKNMR